MSFWRSTRHVVSDRRLLLALIGVTAVVALGCALASLPGWRLQRVSTSGFAQPLAQSPQSIKTGYEPKLLASLHSYLPAGGSRKSAEGGGQFRADSGLGRQHHEILRDFSPLHRRPPPRSS